MSHDESLGSVDVALSPLARFEEYLQSRGKRCTEQRRVILEEVFSRHEHFDADALIEHVAQKTKIGRATIYRALGEFGHPLSNSA